MQRLLALAIALLSPAFRDEPVPPPAGSGAHVTSTLTSDMSVRFTAAGHLLRMLQQHVKEDANLEVDVVERLADHLAERLPPEPAAKFARGELAVETPRGKPPFVRLLYGKCMAEVQHDGVTEDPKETSESEGYLFIERGEPRASGSDEKRRDVRQLFIGTGAVADDVAARAPVDADAFVVGPRLAPLVLGKVLAAGAPIDVPPALLEPLLRQAVADGTVAKATLTPHASAAPDRLAFKIAAVVTWKGGEELPVTATFTLEGELELVKATAQVSALKLAGPIQYGGTSDENGAKLEITGTGSLDFTYAAEPRAKN